MNAFFTGFGVGLLFLLSLELLGWRLWRKHQKRQEARLRAAVERVQAGRPDGRTTMFRSPYSPQVRA